MEQNRNGVRHEFRSNVYEGEVKDGKPNGKGKMTYASGEVYEGEWKGDERHGKGKVRIKEFNHGGHRGHGGGREEEREITFLFPLSFFLRVTPCPPWFLFFLFLN